MNKLVDALAINFNREMFALKDLIFAIEDSNMEYDILSEGHKVQVKVVMNPARLQCLRFTIETSDKGYKLFPYFIGKRNGKFYKAEMKMIERVQEQTIVNNIKRIFENIEDELRKHDMEIQAWKEKRKELHREELFRDLA